MNKNILVVMAILIVGAGAFYGGFAYSKSKTTPAGPGNGTFVPGQGRGQGPGGFGGGTFVGRGAGAPEGAGGGFVSGQVLSTDNSSVTVKLRDGGSKIIFFSTSTQIMKATNGSPADLVADQEITVSGSANSDGTITAQSIQIRPSTTVAR